MSERRVTWRDRYPEGDVTCIRCLQVYDVMELDRLLWCDDCQAKARERAGEWGWLLGFVFAAGLGVYVWFTIRPSADLIPLAWIATFITSVWIGARVSREFVYGAMRFRNARAVEARPPSLEELDSDPGSGDPDGPISPGSDPRVEG